MALSTITAWKRASDCSSDELLSALRRADQNLATAFGRVSGSVPKSTASWTNLCSFFPDGSLNEYTVEALGRGFRASLPADLVASYEATNAYVPTCDCPACLTYRAERAARLATTSNTTSNRLPSLLSSSKEQTAMSTENRDGAPIQAPAGGLLDPLINGAKQGAKQGAAMVAQDIMQDSARKALVEFFGVSPELLQTNSAFVQDMANLVLPAVLNLAATQAPDQIPGAKFVAAAAESAFTGRVSYATYKHGSRLKDLIAFLGPQLNEMRKVGANLLGEELGANDLVDLNANREKVAASVERERAQVERA